MKRLWKFLAGILVGVAGVTLYHIYGKPTLPKFDMDDIDFEIREDDWNKLNIKWRLKDKSTLQVEGISNFDGRIGFSFNEPGAPSMDDTQEIRIEDDEPSAATYEKWARESEG